MQKSQFSDIPIEESQDYNLDQLSNTLFSNIDKVKNPELTESPIVTPIESIFQGDINSHEHHLAQSPATLDLSNTPDCVSNIQIESLNQNMKKYTTSYFIDRQSKDTSIQKIISLLQLASKTPKHLSRYVLVKGILLCRKINKHKSDHLSNLAIVIPKNTLIRLTADIHTLTHCASQRMTKMLRRFYYHQDLAKIAQNISTGCQICSVCNPNTRPSLPEGILHSATTPGEYVYVDFCFMKKSTHLGKTCKYIFTCVDAVSNYVMAFATNDMRASTVIKCLKSVITLFPELKMIISDNQTSLVRNSKVSQFLQSHNIESRLTIPYSSKSNFAETANRLIRKILRAYELAFKKSWLFCFEHSINNLNMTPISTGAFQGISPYEIIFNKSPRNSDPFGTLRNSKNLIKKKLSLKNKIDKIRTENHQQIVDAKTNASKIKVGALVRLLDQSRTSKQSPYFLPNIFEVTSRRGYELHLVDSTDKNIKQRVHIRFVKLCQPISESVLVQLRPKQRQLLGYDKEDHLPDILSNPFTQSSANDSSSDSESSNRGTTQQNQKSTHPNSTAQRRRHRSNSIQPDDSISQHATTTNREVSKHKKPKNVFKRLFGYLQNKTNSTTVKPNNPFLEKSGSFRLGAFRPANESTPNIPLRRSQRLRNLDKIDYKKFNKTGQKVSKKTD